ncbi:winged helix-turn-helix domain-containing protein [Sedimentitalea sp. CAU 1593]|uniref:Winged helix-turn-helix domain-containing protein n=1 Tax=Sedimentitalea arenosa TaxID=2798803 RepID=A0A8J7J585_9RHOB|nr:winged helix-turn-helix domain-containing protein [Arenibacterium arenosum]
MPVPDYETLMRPVLKAFDEGAQNVAEILPKLIEEFDIAPNEAEELILSGRVTVLNSRAHWARTYLSKAGLLTSPKRNHHQITEFGRKMLQINPSRIDNKVWRKWIVFRTGKMPRDDPRGITVKGYPYRFRSPPTTAKHRISVPKPPSARSKARW